jgi:uncharacterized membrane protein
LKVSELFASVNWLWQSHTLGFIGMVTIVYVAIAAIAFRWAQNHLSNAQLYLLFGLAFFFFIGLLENTKTTQQLFDAPLIYILVAAIIGVGCETYIRLTRHY